MKKFAVFDIDGTVFRWQLYSDVVFQLIEDGYIPQEVKTELNVKMSQWRERTHAHSFREYELAVVKAFYTHLKNIPVSAMEAAAETVISRNGTHVYLYTKGLIEQLKRENYILIAISGSHNEIVQKFAELWQFDIALGQAHAAENNTYIASEPTVDELVIFRKGEILKELVKQHGLEWTGSIAVGDSKSDANMLEIVENPIAFNPNEELFSIANERGWKVVIERKNMIYELEKNDGTYVLENASAR
jgi:phosphoserine phosphatase